MLIKLGQRGTLTLPKEIRKDLDQNSLIEVVRRPDGVIELRPQAAIDASQSWFWTERWQRMERETDADFAAGRTRTFDDLETFLADLDSEAE
jgi:bifunctional DNA-binding transcriptional regulator/antitoxin component of YhaV-PrlF toxin-antitoxin module